MIPKKCLLIIHRAGLSPIPIRPARLIFPELKPTVKPLSQYFSSQHNTATGKVSCGPIDFSPQKLGL